MQGDAFKEKLIGWSSDKAAGSHLPSSPLPSLSLPYSPNSDRASESSTKPHAKNQLLMQSKRRRAGSRGVAVVGSVVYQWWELWYSNGGNCDVTAVFLTSLRMQTKAVHEGKECNK